MPRTPRTPPSSPALLLVVLASLLASVLAFPALVVGCAQGDPQAAGIAAVEPTKAQLPTEPPPPPAPAPTQ